MKRALDAESKAWLKKHESKLPRMSAGKSRNLVYAGTLNDLAHIADNPRRGSDVYVGGEYIIVTGQTKLSMVPGAPTMPIKQWLRYTPPKGRNCTHAKSNQIIRRESGSADYQRNR